MMFALEVVVQNVGFVSLGVGAIVELTPLASVVAGATDGGGVSGGV